MVPPLRSGQVSLDEAEHFTAQSSCQRRYAPMVFGIIPECCSASLRKERSASPESPPEPQKQPEPIQPQEDTELEALKKKITARDAEEVQKWAAWHAQELRQREYELDVYTTGKTSDFD